MSQMQPNQGRTVAALVLIGLGVLFLLGYTVSLGTLWPFFIIVPGLVFLYFAFTGSRDLASLAIPGAIITGTGVILLYQNATGRWASWAYVWTLYPVFLGLGLMYLGRRTGDESTLRSGRGFVTWGGVAFLFFGEFFEVFIFGGFGLTRYALPLILILVGGWLLLRGQGRQLNIQFGGKPKRPAVEEPPVTGAPVVKPRRRPRRTSASERLRQEIDAALAEEEKPAPVDEPPADEPEPSNEPAGGDGNDDQ